MSSSDYVMYGREGVNREQKLHNIVQALTSAQIAGNTQRAKELKRRLDLHTQRTKEPPLSRGMYASGQ